MSAKDKGAMRARLVSLGVGLAFVAVAGKGAILALTPISAEAATARVFTEQPRRAAIRLWQRGQDAGRSGAER
jgi:hypothetical protein